MMLPLWFLACVLPSSQMADMTGDPAPPALGRLREDIATSTEVPTLADPSTVIGSGEMPAPDALPENPIIVVWIIDTLSVFAEDEVGHCRDLQEILGPFGRDVDCRGGAISPSSWTIEAIVRLMWPEFLQEEGSSLITPSCELASAPVRLARALGARSTIGFDNPMLDRMMSSRGRMCGLRHAWISGFDTSYSTSSTISLTDLTELDDSERSVNQALEDILRWAHLGEPVVAVLNEAGAGGHVPRCPGEPTASCSTLRDIAIETEVADKETSYSETMLDSLYWSGLHHVLTSTVIDIDDDSVRNLIADTIVESARYYWTNRTIPRLEQLIYRLTVMGRINDLVLVVVSDHGERPCHRSSHTGRRSCSHGEVPDEWTAAVPVFIWPGGLADRWESMGLLGNETQVWSSANLTYALHADFVGEYPEAWPEPSPVGTAASWSCWGTNLVPRIPMGLRIEGDTALQCSDSCTAMTWSPASSRDHSVEPVDIEDLPSTLADWMGDGALETSNRFTELCGWTE